jgi:hypothetical protein
MLKSIVDSMGPGWRVSTATLLTEILQNNPGMGIFAKPLNILGKLLAAVADRAAEINDPQLNALMLRLTFYEMADPAHPSYDAKTVTDLIEAGRRVPGAPWPVPPGSLDLKMQASLLANLMLAVKEATEAHAHETEKITAHNDIDTNWAAGENQQPLPVLPAWVQSSQLLIQKLTAK